MDGLCNEFRQKEATLNGIQCYFVGVVVDPECAEQEQEVDGSGL